MSEEEDYNENNGMKKLMGVSLLGALALLNGVCWIYGVGYGEGVSIPLIGGEVVVGLIGIGLIW